jgi:hypothetical protein
VGIDLNPNAHGINPNVANIFVLHHLNTENVIQTTIGTDHGKIDL